MDGDGEQAGCYTELAVFITLATFRKHPDSGIIFMVVRPTTRDLLNQTMMSNRWDTVFSRFVSCPNDKTGAKLTAKGGKPGGSD